MVPLSLSIFSGKQSCRCLTAASSRSIYMPLIAPPKPPSPRHLNAWWANAELTVSAWDPKQWKTRKKRQVILGKSHRLKRFKPTSSSKIAPFCETYCIYCRAILKLPRKHQLALFSFSTFVSWCIGLKVPLVLPGKTPSKIDRVRQIHAVMFQHHFCQPIIFQNPARGCPYFFFSPPNGLVQRQVADCELIQGPAIGWMIQVVIATGGILHFDPGWTFKGSASVTKEKKSNHNNHMFRSLNLPITSNQTTRISLRKP